MEINIFWISVHWTYYVVLFIGRLRGSIVRLRGWVFDLLVFLLSFRNMTWEFPGRQISENLKERRGLQK